MNTVKISQALLKGLQLITLESFYDVWQQPLANDLFSKILQLKLKGYLHEYPYGILPVDTTDFIATHHILCRKTAAGFTPLMAYKSTSLEKCEAHRIPFPAMNLLNKEGLGDHRKVLETLLQDCKKKKQGVTYDCSWTIDPEIRKNRPFTTELRNIFQTTHILFHEEKAPRVSVVCGVLRFKTDQFFENWGYERLKLGAQDLNKFPHPSLDGEEVVIMKTNQFKETARAVADQYKEIWNSRILIRHEGADQVAAPLKKTA